MRASEGILKGLNKFVSIVVVLILVIAGVYCVYALWDNSQVYAAAQNVQEDMLELKPVQNEDGGASFEELLKINPDVCAWLTMDNTKIDYPILQGEDNLSYINTDVYGDFALAGSIFLDSSCDKNFKDSYSLVYGHHMEGGKMFGDLDLYKDKKFFDENKSGTLILPKESYNLEIFSCMVVPASEENIFNPSLWKENPTGLAQFAKQNSMYVREDVIELIGKPNGYSQILGLSTCASEFTDARTVVLAVMKPYR